jgi:malonyl-CoA decarboxylase
MSERAPIGFFDTVVDRTLTNLRSVWREIASSTRGVLSGAPRPDLPEDDAQRLRQQMQSCLDGAGGEVGARARAAELGRTFLALNEAGRARFLHVLAEEFGVDHAAVDRCCAPLAAAKTPAERAAAQQAMRAALTPPRLRLLRQFNALPEGVKFLVDRRAELIALAADGDLAMRSLADDLRELLADWFDIGFLELRRISWESSAALLEKLIAYEAVHEIQGWTDLKNRLEADRRCFAFFHPRMPDEPLIFVEVALVKGMAGNIHALLDEAAPHGDPTAADSAIFYSISNCQRGLNGISFGDFLIKRVVDALTGELPRLKIFATLSPVPGFRAWLARQGKRPDLLLPAEAKALTALAGNGAHEPDLLHLLERSDWHAAPALCEALREPLTRLCAQYLLLEKGRSGRAADPVAHFHLTNGARVERLNWQGDLSEKGLQQSAGIMVNYLYRLDHIDANHEAYRGEGKVAASSAVRHLLRQR